MFQFEYKGSKKTKQNYRPNLKAVRQEEFSEGLSLFVLFRLSTDWMRQTPH
jgi:hypothetical protein